MGSISQKRQDRSEWFAEQCARAGIKATRQRLSIYDELARSKEHPDAEAIFHRVRRRIPRISLDTVYRNLRTLDECGLIKKVGATGYRARFDANMTPHHHFVCSVCDAIHDFQDDRFDRIKPGKDVADLGEVVSLRVELLGVCRRCASKKRAGNLPEEGLEGEQT